MPAENGTAALLLGASGREAVVFGLSGDFLLKGFSFPRTACVFDVSRPKHGVILEIQTDDVLIVAMPAAVDDFSEDGRLIRKRSDLRNLSRLPLAI
jgi:hypothetical protein